MPILSKAAWKCSWEQHLAEYLAVAPRTGMYLELLFPNKSWKFLELAAGSLRDANYLALQGFDSTGSDYLEELIEKAYAIHANPALKIMVIDAFNTTLADKAYDVTFHNGFLICYRDNAVIKQILDEQYRITSKFMVVIVHCAHNAKLRRLFVEKARSDPLYDDRFFSTSELCALLNPYGRVQLYGFGGRLSTRLLPGRCLARLPIKVRQILYYIFSRLEPPKHWERILATVRVG